MENDGNTEMRHNFYRAGLDISNEQKYFCYQLGENFICLVLMKKQQLQSCNKSIHKQLLSHLASYAYADDVLVFFLII